MTAFDRSERFEHELPDILTAIAAPRVPDYVDDLLARAAATRQRPRRTFPERWLPMADITRSRAFAPAPPWRLIAMALVVIALLALAVLAYAGAQRHVPAPFGPARNGLIPYDKNGDIYVGDPVTGQTKLVVSGPDNDTDAGYSPDVLPAGAIAVVHLTPSVWAMRSWRQRVEDVCAEAERLIVSLDDDWTRPDIWE